MLNKPLRLGLLLILLALIALFLIHKKESKKSIDTYDREFAIEDDNSIGAIRIIPRDSPVLKLNREGNSWKINDKYPVRKDAIDNLLEVLTGLRIKYIPNQKASENILREMAVLGIKIDIYDKKDRKIKSYLMGGSPPDGRGTYFLMEGASQPYTMELVTLDGDVRPRFITSELDWRTRTMLDLDVSDILELTIDYPKQKNKSFKITKEEDQYYVKPLNPILEGRSRKLREKLVESYLLAYQNLTAEYIENNNPKRDSISQLLPFCDIQINLSNGDSKSMKFFPLVNLMDPNARQTDISIIQAVERYFVDCSWNDFMLVQQKFVGPYFREYDYFFEP